MGGDISMQLETENVQVFDPKQFAKEYKKTGLGNESMWQFFSNSYEELVSTVVRPQADNGKYGRAQYNINLLGPSTFTLCGTKYIREDFEIKNKKGLTLVCSYWSIFDNNVDDEEQQSNNSNTKKKKTSSTSCVVYLHSTIGSRVESLQALIPCLRAGCNFFSFDFSGSGMSEGEHVTWGWFENNDVVDVVKYVMGNIGCKKIVLWGRNLGAATAILYSSKDPRIKGLILDTPYSSFEETLQEGIRYAGKEGVAVPNIVLKAAQSTIVRALRKRITPKFKIQNLQPRASAKKCKCPSLFVAALRDNYITPKQVEHVFKVYRGSKSFTFIDLRHFETRSYMTCFDFFTTAETFLTSLFKNNKALPGSKDENNEMNPVYIQKNNFAWILQNQKLTHKLEHSHQQLKLKLDKKENKTVNKLVGNNINNNTTSTINKNDYEDEAVLDAECKTAIDAISLREANFEINSIDDNCKKSAPNQGEDTFGDDESKQ
eukprot:g2006.t1